MKFSFLILFTIFNYLLVAQIKWDKIYYTENRIIDFTVDSNDVFYWLTSESFYVSHDYFNSFKAEMEGLDNNDFGYYSDIIVVNNKFLVINGARNLFISSIDSISWYSQPLGNIYSVNVINSVGNTIYLGTDTGMYVTYDMGKTYKYLDFDHDSTNNRFSPLVWKILPLNDSTILAGTNCGVYRTTNYGFDWERTGYFNCGDVTAIASAGNGRLYTGGQDRMRGLWRSLDDGKNWTKILNGDLFVSSIYSIGEHIFIGCDFKGIYHSTVQNDTVWIKTCYGFNDGYTDKMLADKENYLYILAHNKIYRSSEPIIPSPNKKVQKNFSFCLEQNYPNPFSKTTTIEFSVAGKETTEKFLSVHLDVYNILGQKISNILNNTFSPGKYSVQFNANNLPNGVYFYSLRAGEFTATKKMILMK